MSYSLLIPVYNEKKSLPELLDKLGSLNEKIEIIIINDGSDDGTEHILNKQKKFKVINNQKNLGKGASIRNGLYQANKENIIIIDGDLEISIYEIPKIIKIFENINEIKKTVVGIRWKNESQNYFNIMRLANFLINNLFNLLYHSSMNDILCCLKVINKEYLKSFDLKSNGFSIETEIMIKVVKNNFSIKEVLISYKARSFRDGKKIKIRDAVGIISTMLQNKYKLK